MQALPAHASSVYKFSRLSLSDSVVELFSTGDLLRSQLKIAQSDIEVYNDSRTYLGTIKKGELYLSNIASQPEENHEFITVLGDAKSILGSGSSSGLSEEQKTMIKDLIANWPGLCRLVEKFNERNDDNDEYEKT